MSELAILGAGDLGGALAHRAASRDRFRRVWLIDPNEKAAAGKALDVLQAGSIDGVTTRVEGSSMARAATASVIVVADRFGPPSDEWSGDEGLAVVAEAAALAPRAVVVCAGAGHRTLVARAVAEAGVARTRIVGSAPEAFVAVARSAMAITLDASALDTALTLAGEIPDGMLIEWGVASTGSQAVVARLPPSERQRFASMVPYLWPPGPYALASAACRAAESAASNGRVMQKVWAWLDGATGTLGSVATQSVRLTSQGIARVAESALAAPDGERAADASETAARPHGR